MPELFAGVLLVTGLVMTLVALVLTARSLLAPRGDVAIRVNDERTLVARAGDRLLAALGAAGIHVPAACGGKGTCGLCRIRVGRGGGAVRPLESDLFSRRDLAAGMRLACQVMLREDLDAYVPEEILDVRSVETTVRSTVQVASLMKEIDLALPPEAGFEFRTGSFVQVTCPPYVLGYEELDIAEAYRETWDRLQLRRLRAEAKEPTTRAYSLANHAGEKGGLLLIVRLATPPPQAEASVPPGVVSSWLFGRRPGDVVTVSGPYGEFFVEEEDRELVFVGGGAGMAPMRAHILDQLEGRGTEVPITFFYGARNLQELFYDELFDRLQAEHANFRWYVSLSDPRPEDGWDGRMGYVHEHVDAWVAEHPAPEDCAYYLCGPPLMLRAVRTVLDGVGVPADAVHADDFGGS